MLKRYGVRSLGARCDQSGHRAGGVSGFDSRPTPPAVAMRSVLNGPPRGREWLKIALPEAGLHRVVGAFDLLRAAARAVGTGPRRRGVRRRTAGEHVVVHLRPLGG